MGNTIQLAASDGHRFSAYRAEPSGVPKGGLIVAMEIFGVNSHIRSVADGYAADGFLVIAPALFDRAEPGYETGYSPEEIQRGIGMIGRVDLDQTMLDIAASAANVAEAGRVGILGYCWGGTVSWKAACTLDSLACSVPYYGGGIPGLVALMPKCPVMFHWGESDASIPMDKAREFAAAHADQIHHFYAAGHGFNCEQRGSFDVTAANLARGRTLAFLAEHVG